jgi:hypothetical protein
MVKRVKLLNNEPIQDSKKHCLPIVNTDDALVSSDQQQQQQIGGSLFSMFNFAMNDLRLLRPRF